MKKSHKKCVERIVMRIKAEFIVILVVIICIVSYYLNNFWETSLINPLRKKENTNFSFTGHSHVKPSFTEEFTKVENTKKILQISSSDKDEIIKLISSLDTLNFDYQEKIKRNIISRAEQSDVERNFIINELLKYLENNKDIHEILTSQNRYNKWKASLDILGELKAVEGLDYYINCLDCGFGYSESLSGYPAYKVVVKLGEAAIPALSVSIISGRKNVRFMSAHALAEIGGEQAKTVLESALVNEQDDFIRNFIENNLKHFK